MHLITKVNLIPHSWQESEAVSGTQTGLIRPSDISLLHLSFILLLLPECFSHSLNTCYEKCCGLNSV